MLFQAMPEYTDCGITLLFHDIFNGQFRLILFPYGAVAGICMPRLADFAQQPSVTTTDRFKLQDRVIDTEKMIKVVTDFFTQHLRLAHRLIVHFHMA